MNPRDVLNKIADFDDYSVHGEVFSHLDGLWGPHTIEIFVSCFNTKLPRFNSKFLQPLHFSSLFIWSFFANRSDLFMTGKSKNNIFGTKAF